MLIILLVAFGALVAAGLPLVLGATAVAATVGLLGPVSQVYALAPDVAELVVIIGLAVGVDYAMFYSRRMMEERDRGHSTEAALEIAAATSGRAVLISGLTVMTAMAGLLFAGNPIFSAFGIGTMLVVAVTVLGSMTFLPATLSFLGEKNWLEKGRVPYVTKRRHQSKGESRVWGAILTRVLKRPLVSVVIAGGLLVALCIPALGHAVQGPGLRRLLAQPAGHPDLRPRPGRLPRRRRPGHDRDQGRGRHRRAASRPRSRSCTTRRSPPASSPSPPASTSAPTRPSPSSPSRSRAAAPTPPPIARSRSCAPRSSRPPSASWPAPKSP